MCALDAEVFNFTRTPRLIGRPRARRRTRARERYCEQQPLSAAMRTPSQSVGFFGRGLKGPEVIMQNGKLTSRENQGEMRGDEEAWERGMWDYTLEMRAKAAPPSSWAALHTFHNIYR